ncbi:NAD(P)/FAD-dependent oxidoreductase [Roseibium salinum]|uniref:FAD-dependent oxidoreductase n=1 Tax=Roseibium salinum TaxID=1604349 RepID=A0ABT3QW87_9HYPH|nr:FAD-dependent oxidoreductase [Roseibium sp. DSM 29163]MCX2721194.1 FAD-dependent oxidoreductase [Roseibium sp. DSM 29163]
MSTSAIVIAGAGECGTRAAFALREHGYQGAVILIGEEPHFPYERPPLSKSPGAGPKTVADREKFQAAGIEFLSGVCVRTIDRAAREIGLGDGRTIPYHKLLLATGAAPKLFPGMEGARTFRALGDAQAVHGQLAPGRHLVVVGGGFIGLELAAAARIAGADVTVVEAADRLMPRIVPAEIAAIAEAEHRDKGVSLFLGTGVVSATERQVTLSDGRMVEGDLVVAGVGVAPNTALAEAAGLAVDNGIVVDGCFATSDPDIFAAGDCCSFPYRGRNVRLESWRAARDQADHAAAAILGAEELYAAVPWFWSDQYGLTLQVAGLPAPVARTTRRACGNGAFILFEQDADGVLVAASGIGTGNAVAKDIRLAEMLIGKGVPVEADALADPAVNLKKLLRGQE